MRRSWFRQAGQGSSLQQLVAPTNVWTKVFRAQHFDGQIGTDFPDYLNGISVGQVSILEHDG